MELVILEKKRYDDMKYNAVDDKAGVSRYKKRP